MNRIITIALLLAMTVGCSTTNSGFRKPDLTKISLGMMKEQVIGTLGKPDAFSVLSNTEELLEYGWDKFGDGVTGPAEWFYVRLVDGKVAAYGQDTSKSRRNDPMMIIPITPVPRFR